MAWNISWEPRASIHAQYVGTRAVNQPYLTQVNGYQTVCPGCFAPFPYAQSTDPRFGAVTQFSTGANSHYDGLQLTAMKRLGTRLHGTTQLHLEPLHGYRLKRRIPAVLGRRQFCLPSGRLGARLRPLRLRHPAQPQCSICLSIASQGPKPSLGYALNGWQVSGTVFWHSGIPFSVLSTPIQRMEMAS